jgi:hypothetical protein
MATVRGEDVADLAASVAANTARVFGYDPV